MTTKIATQDVTVDAPHATVEELALLPDLATALSAVDPHGTDIDKSIAKLARAAARSPKANTATKNLAASTTKAAAARKPAAKAKVANAPTGKVARVPAEQVLALIAELGLTKTQYGQAIGVSPSMVSEHVGKGRGNLLAASRWVEVQKTVRAWAKKSVK